VLAAVRFLLLLFRPAWRYGAVSGAVLRSPGLFPGANRRADRHSHADALSGAEPVGLARRPYRPAVADRAARRVVHPGLLRRHLPQSELCLAGADHGHPRVLLARGAA